MAIVLDDADAGDTGRSYPGPEAAPKEAVAESIARLSEEQLNAGVSWRDLLEYGIGAAFQDFFEEGDILRERIREIRGEIADAQTAQRSEIEALKLAHGKLVNENQALRLVLENLRVHSATKGASTAIEGRLEEMAFKVQLGLAASVANVARESCRRRASFRGRSTTTRWSPIRCCRADIEGQRCA